MSHIPTTDELINIIERSKLPDETKKSLLFAAGGDENDRKRAMNIVMEYNKKMLKIKQKKRKIFERAKELLSKK